MAIRTYRPNTPGTRTLVVTDFSEVTGKKRERGLVVAKHRRKGRNNRGVITCRHRGGGHKRLYRLVDFRRDKHGVVAKVIRAVTIAGFDDFFDWQLPNGGMLSVRLSLADGGPLRFSRPLDGCD